MKAMRLLAAASFTIVLAAQAKADAYSPDARRLDQQWVNSMCARVVTGQNSEMVIYTVEEVAGKSISETTISCVVKSERLTMNDRKGSSYTREKMAYSVKIDLSKGESSLERIDEEAAKEAALKALAEKLIKIESTELSASKLSMSASIDGNTCQVEATLTERNGISKWQADNIVCSH
ncbi:hypothetical protein ACI2KR_27010 [Pseudomonas luteola]